MFLYMDASMDMMSNNITGCNSSAKRLYAGKRERSSGCVRSGHASEERAGRFILEFFYQDSMRNMIYFSYSL